MNIEKFKSHLTNTPEQLHLFIQINKIWHQLQKCLDQNFKRTLPLADYFVDRWEKAQVLGFGKGTSIYDSSLVMGQVEVGENTWIGPGTILDGSGGLKIGSFCSISAGVQIYSHDTVEWALSGGKEPMAYAPTQIGDRCYLGPNTVIAKGVSIGDGSVIGANSLVLRDIPPNSKAYGTPCKVMALVDEAKTE